MLFLIRSGTRVKDVSFFDRWSVISLETKEMGKENTKLRIVDVDFSLLPLPFLSEIIKMSKERGEGEYKGCDKKRKKERKKETEK